MTLIRVVKDYLFLLALLKNFSALGLEYSICGNVYYIYSRQRLSDDIFNNIYYWTPPISVE